MKSANSNTALFSVNYIVSGGNISGENQKKRHFANAVMRRVRAVYGGRIVKFVRKQHDRVCGGSNYA